MAAPEHLYDLKRLRAEPPHAPFYAVLGHPVAHSKSPAMQQAALDALGIDARYIALDVAPEELAEALELLPELGAKGCNVTVPHKTAVCDWLAAGHGTVSPFARAARAVNTVAWTPDGALGHGTDGGGWEEAVREAFGLELPGQTVLLLGAGGAGATIALHAASRGARVLLANRSREKAEEVEQAARRAAAVWKGAGTVEVVPWEGPALAAAAQAGALVVNATSLGLQSGEPFPFATELFHPKKAYSDLVYAAEPTPFLTAAAQAGGRTADGLSMLLHQGLLAFLIWHGPLAEGEVARAAIAMRHALGLPPRPSS